MAIGLPFLLIKPATGNGHGPADDTALSGFKGGETVILPLYLTGALQREISPQIQVLSTLVRLASVVRLAQASPPRGDDGGSRH
jgi:hypothetical protein